MRVNEIRRDKSRCGIRVNEIRKDKGRDEVRVNGVLKGDTENRTVQKIKADSKYEELRW